MRTRKSKKTRKKPASLNTIIAAAERAQRRREGDFDALQHLRLIQHGAHITELYRTFFPQEFAQDPPDYSDPQRLMYFYDRFTGLVSRRLFPIYELSEIDMAFEEPGYHLHHIHICMINKWLWYNQEEDYRYTGYADHIHIVEKLVVSATNKESVFPDVDFRPPAGYKFRLPRLRRLCRGEKGMLGRLGLVADAILGATGNEWLDLSEEEYGMSEMPSWTEEQVRFLAEEYAEAKFLNKGITEFFKWCNSPGKVERVKRLLRSSWVKEEEEERLRIRVARRSHPLVETLGGVL